MFYLCRECNRYTKITSSNTLEYFCSSCKDSLVRHNKLKLTSDKIKQEEISPRYKNNPFCLSQDLWNMLVITRYPCDCFPLLRTILLGQSKWKINSGCAIILYLKDYFIFELKYFMRRYTNV